MDEVLGGCAARRHRQGLEELREELESFSHDGLVQLMEDLLGDRVLRGSWAGCVLSYSRGAPGSSRRDRNGRSKNAFTELWDSGWITDEAVLAAVARERARRSAGTPPPRRPTTTSPGACSIRR